MNTITTTVALICVMLCVVTTTSFAQKEDTGKVLQSLVERIDTKLTALETQVEKQAKVQKTIRDDLAKTAQKFNAETNQIVRLDLKSDVIYGLSELNKTDREQVTTTLDTIVGVVSDLSQIEEKLNDSQLSPEAIRAQQMRIRTALLGAGPILSALSATLDNPKARIQAKATEQTLVMLYKQLATPRAASAGVASQVSQSLEVLNNVATQLKMVSDLLEMERVALQVAAHNTVAESVLGRMTMARLGNREIGAVAVKMHDDIQSRFKDYMPVVGTTVVGGLADGPAETDQQTIIENIRKGIVPEIK
jgi:hypothetical protein